MKTITTKALLTSLEENRHPLAIGNNLSDVKIPHKASSFLLLTKSNHEPCQPNTPRIPETSQRANFATINTPQELPVLTHQSIEDLFTPKELGVPLQKEHRHHHSNIAPPDISRGLGKRKENGDIVALEHFVTQVKKLMVYNGELYEFISPCWKKLNARDCSISLRRLFSDNDLDSNLTSKDYSEVYNMLLCCPEIQVNGHITPPDNAINFVDGTLWLDDMTFCRHNPDDHFFTYIDVSYDDILDCEYGEYFERYMMQVCSENPDVRRQILELTGLICTGYQAKVCYYFVGPAHCGKSQVTRFLEELIGRENVASIAGPQDFGQRFTIGSLVDKRLAVCGDCGNIPLSPSAIGILKTFTGGDDAVKAERKYKDAKTIYEKALLLLCSNYRLQIPNAAQEEALLERIVIVPFGKPVEKNAREPKLFQRFISERAYIISQMIPVYKELMNRNYAITRVSVPEEYAIEEGRSQLKKVQAFINERCILSQHYEVSSRELYNAYLEEVVHLNEDVPSRIDFARCISEVLRQYPTVTAVKRTNGMDERGYRGIRLKQEMSEF